MVLSFYKHALTTARRVALSIGLPRTLGVLGLAASIAAAIAFRHDAGVTIDEPAQMRYARWIAAWFASGFHDRRALVRDLTLAHYGGLFEAAAQLAVHFTPEDPVGTRHAASALCAVAGLVATWKMAERLGGSAAGLLAATLLGTTPVWVGHGLFNPKDIPFAAAAAWSVWAGQCILMSAGLPSYRLHAACGVAIGAALGVRPGGMFLLAYPLGAWVGRWWLHVRRPERQTPAADAPTIGRLRQVLPRLAVIACLAWACMLLAWPWAQVDPLRRPWEAARFAARSGWGGTMLFGGHIIAAQRLPSSYLPVWFAITLPETYFIAAACALVLLGLAWRRGMRVRQHELGLAYVATAAFGPVLGQILTHSPIYDAQRHFLFVLPPMAAVAGAAMYRFAVERTLPSPLRKLTGSVLLAALLLLCREMTQLHPYEYVYFNRFVGGLSGAARRYETDYWAASNTEGMRWLAERFGRHGRAKVSVATCNHDESVSLFLREHPALAKHITLEPRAAYADILLANTRDNCHKVHGRVLHVVEREGVPLLYVIGRRALAAGMEWRHTTTSWELAH